MRVPIDSVRQKQRVRAFCEAVKVIVEFLQKCALYVLFVKTTELAEWKYVLLLVSSCCDNSKGKDMAGV